MRYPFSAVVGHDEVKLALLLNAVDPRIGGVLLRGQKGSAKSTLARALSSLLRDAAPFVDLPVGTTEDRLVGSIDVDAALSGGGVRFRPGLLAAADGGVLYIDEANLLPDHLVDVLLDVAASGVNRVEREGISETHPSRIVLVGSMNPEEGDLRPQLLDRFGLAADVMASNDPAERAEAVRRRLDFDRDQGAFISRWAEEEHALRDRLAAASSAALPDELVDTVSRLCAAVGAEGLRADLVICRAAAALAGLEGREATTEDDVRRVAHLALAHRRRRSPLEDPGISQQEVDDALASPEQTDPEEGGGTPERTASADEPTRVKPLGNERLRNRGISGRRSTAEGDRGRVVGDRAPTAGSSAPVAVVPTLRAAARRSNGGAVEVRPEDRREPVRLEKVGNLVVLSVDASGSMGAERRMEAVKGAVLSLLLDAYQRRDRVALVTFRDDAAQVVLRPTASVEVARARMESLPTGGRTPLAAGITEALELAATAAGDRHPLLVLVSDGRATSGPDAVDEALRAADAVRARRVRAVVVDAEDGPTRLGLAPTLAEAMGARYIRLPELAAGALAAAVTNEVLAR